MKPYFRQLLLEARRQQLLKAGRWVPWKALPKDLRWVYPTNLERSYSNQLQRLMRLFAQANADWVQENLQRLIDAQAARLDSVKDDLTPYPDAFHEAQLEAFGPQSTGYTANIIRVGDGIASFNKTQWNKWIKAMLGHEYYPAEPWLEGIVQEWAEVNHTLIKSLSNEYITKSNTLMQEAILGGEHYPEIVRKLRDLNQNLTVNRAKLIAVDQVGKLNGRLAMHRQLEAGFTMYTWETAGDERVRAIHRTLDGKVCKYIDPTVYRDEGVWVPRTPEMERANPGQPIRCRCVGIPFLEPMQQEIDTELAEDPELTDLS